MTHDEIVAFLTDRQGSWQRRDAAALAVGHTEDGIVVSPMFGTIYGRSAIEESYRSLFATFPDWEFIAGELVVDGERAVQSFNVTATHTKEFFGLSPSGRRFEIRGALIYRFSGALIAHERRLYDFASLLLQIGVLKVKPVQG